MKKFFCLLILLFVGAGLAIFILPNFFHNKEKKLLSDKNEFDLHKNTIIDLNSDMREPEIYDPSQMYFESIEILFNDYGFTLNQIEDLKQEVQNYVKENIGKMYLDCKLVKESIEENDNKLILEFLLEDNITVKVSVQKKEKEKVEILEITHIKQE